MLIVVAERDLLLYASLAMIFAAVVLGFGLAAFTAHRLMGRRRRR